MKEVSDAVWNFALEAFHAEIENLLDDPFILSEEPERVPFLQQVAHDLDIDLEVLFKEYGTEYEVVRIRKWFPYQPEPS